MFINQWVSLPIVGDDVVGAASRIDDRKERLQRMINNMNDSEKYEYDENLKLKNEKLRNIKEKKRERIEKKRERIEDEKRKIRIKEAAWKRKQKA